MGPRKNAEGNYLDKGCFCIYCQKWVGRLDRHLISLHSSEIGVRRWLAQEDKKAKNYKLTVLVNKGNDLHNLKVLEKVFGELIVKRGPADAENANPDKYMPCDLCRVWFCGVQLYRHDCPEATTEKKPSRKKSKEIVSGAQAGVTEAMAVVLASLARDEVGEVVRSDFLLREYLRFQTQSELYKIAKNRDQLKGKLRYGARLLIQLRKEIPNSTFLELLTKNNFEKILVAAKACAEGEDGRIHSQTPIRIGSFLNELIERATKLAIDTDDHAREFDLGQLQKLKKLDWTVRVVKQAKYLNVLRQANQIIKLPTTVHVVKFSIGLTKFLEQALIRYREDPTLPTFRRLQKVLLIKIITFNRNRATIILYLLGIFVVNKFGS
jgi:hypothetical protein